MNAVSTTRCKEDSTRRKLTRKSPLFALDYVEVSDDQTRLSLFFLGKAPTDLQRENVVVTGGTRIRDLRVVAMQLEPGAEDLDDRLLIELSGPGDYSSYRLSIVAVDATGRATSQPRPDFDPRYSSLEFSFKTLCPSERDCRADECDQPLPTPSQNIDYLAKDYSSFRQLMLDRLALNLPGYTERHAADLGIALVEVLAYVADSLSYEQDAVASEAYLDTARRRVSVRRHLRLIDQRLGEGCNARAWLTLSSSQDLKLNLKDVYFATRAAGVEAPLLDVHDLPPLTADGYRIFEPLWPNGELTVRAAHDEIRFHTWFETECCLKVGATSATLLDPGGIDSDGMPQYALQLAVGDVLIFEEVKGPRTGNPADADRTHRHAVRLTRAERGLDPLVASDSTSSPPESEGEAPETEYEGDPGSEGDPGDEGGYVPRGTPIWHIEWAQEDALPFALCLSSIGQACQLVTDVSVARGNVILVDHGRTVDDEDLGSAAALKAPRGCPDPCSSASREPPTTRFRPWLSQPDLTFSAELPDLSSASARQLVQTDASHALPIVQLKSWLPESAGEGAAPRDWSARLDLLSATLTDRSFVAEVDDDRRVQLRFGRGSGGLPPLPGERFVAKYRIGNGVMGNVGAEAITHIVFKTGLPSGVLLAARNPLPASGGAAPETVHAAKLRAPERLRAQRERAVIAADYAEIVERDFAPQVQRAAALWRWNGHGAEIVVAVDARGRAEATPELLTSISQHLQKFRRIGHDVHVAAASQVPLRLELRVCVAPGYQRGHVERALLDVLGSRRYGDGKLALFHPDRLSFGGGVYASSIIAAAQAVIGVESVELLALERLYEGPNGELELGVLELGALEIARVDSDPSFPEHGQVRLILEGGR